MPQIDIILSRNSDLSHLCVHLNLLTECTSRSFHVSLEMYTHRPICMNQPCPSKLCHLCKSVSVYTVNQSIREKSFNPCKSSKPCKSLHAFKSSVSLKNYSICVCKSVDSSKTIIYVNDQPASLQKHGSGGRGEKE
jgi:hypothetical protein